MLKHSAIFLGAIR